MSCPAECLLCCLFQALVRPCLRERSSMEKRQIRVGEANCNSGPHHRPTSATSHQRSCRVSDLKATWSPSLGCRVTQNFTSNHWQTMGRLPRTARTEGKLRRMLGAGRWRSSSGERGGAATSSPAADQQYLRTVTVHDRPSGSRTVDGELSR